jgi:N-acetylornithine carbamoyltransferase
MKPRHFIRLRDWSDQYIAAILETAAKVKARRGLNPVAAGKSLAMIMFDASLRTKVSFEIAAYELGAGCSLIHPGKGSWNLETELGVVMDGDKAEHLKEAIQVLSSYVDAIGIRAFPGLVDMEADREDRLMHLAAQYSEKPVINLESSWEHPCQGLADWMTLNEHFDGETKGKKFVLSWVAHPRALPMSVPNTTLEIAARAGMDVVVTCPPEMELHPEWVKQMRSEAEHRGGSVRIEHNQTTALEGADVVYAKGWSGPVLYKSPEHDIMVREREMGKWTITEEKLLGTNKAQFMHCLPVRRNVIVSDEVLDGEQTLHLQQAENRLHVQKALLMHLWNLS